MFFCFHRASPASYRADSHSGYATWAPVCSKDFSPKSSIPSRLIPGPPVAQSNFNSPRCEKSGNHRITIRIKPESGSLNFNHRNWIQHEVDHLPLCQRYPQDLFELWWRIFQWVKIKKKLLLYLYLAWSLFEGVVGGFFETLSLF